MNDLAAKMEQWRTSVEAALDRFFPEEDRTWNLLNQACRYSLLAGGKRLRPILVPALAEAIETGSLKEGTDYVKPTADALLRLAAAIEMIHTYSLIHDDLPAMDNDELRRGRPTNHVVYGEAVAILAGDALLNRAYELLFDLALNEGERGAGAGREVARLAGKDGMIGGQILDITYPTRQQGTAVQGQTNWSEQVDGSATGADAISQPVRSLPPEDYLQLLQSMKTGALLSTPLNGTARLYGLNQDLLVGLDRFGDLLGRAFQIQDDLLDVEATGVDLGKTVGKDARDHKLTYVTLLGPAGAKDRLAQVTSSLHNSLKSLARAGLQVTFLSGLVDFLNVRRS